MHEKQCPGGHLKQCVLSVPLQNKCVFLLEHLQNAAVEKKAMAGVLEK